MDIEATPRAKTVDTGALYEAVRQRFLTLVRELDTDALATRVPATPAWTVHDALAHVVGITADLNALDFGSVDPDVWTAAQVAKRRDADIEAMASEWDKESPQFEDGLRMLGYEVGSHYVGDLHAHLQDVRQALGRPADRDHATVLVSLDFYLFSASELLRDTGVGTVEINVGSETHHLGAGPTVANLTGEAFEILRALSARRSAAQIAALDWTGDAGRVISTLGRYPLPERDLVD